MPDRETDILRSLLQESHDQLLAYIRTHYGDEPLDELIPLWGGTDKLGKQIAHLQSEDFYHAGQVGFIRLASDPTFDYDSAIYGTE